MLRKNTVEIKRRATLWAIYEVAKDGLKFLRKDVNVSGKPECEIGQVAVAIAKGHVVFTMSYDEFVKNANSEFIEEETSNAD